MPHYVMGDGKICSHFNHADQMEYFMGQLQAIIVPVTPFQQNCTILFDAETKKGVVIDPGGDLE
ncbi:hypothetical protein P8631_18570, partial [Guyparkeria sp. 1SP6A2]|nr:hypothetical protein [Guyparkeria sp. 1SP6A2]